MSDVMWLFGCTCRVFGRSGCWWTRLTAWEAEVESARGRSRCPLCGFRCEKVWDRRSKRVRDLAVSGRWTTLVWRRRFWCSNCGERHLEDHDQFQGGLSRRLARRLVEDARVICG